MSNPKTITPRPDAFQLVCLGLLALYAVFLTWESTPIAGGADSSGYLTSARLITEGRLMQPPRTIPELPLEGHTWVYTPLGMIAGGTDTALRPTYPVGLPLHFALASTVLGWDWGPIAVNVAGALALVILTYLGARLLGAGRWVSAAAAGALALSPILVFTSIQPLSDTLSATWNMAAFYCALRARRAGAGGASWGWSVACGAAVAVAVLVRPSDAWLVPALCLVLGDWRRLLGAFLGGVPGAVLLAWYNHTLYGSPWVTGYGSIFALIGPEWLIPSLKLYGSWLPRVFPLLVVAALVAPWLPWRALWREVGALVLWFFAFAGFFALYSCTHEVWWYLRFVLPAFPALAILAALGIDRLPAPARVRLAVAMAVVLITGVLGNRIFTRFGVYHMAEGQEPYRALAHWARENLPPEAAVMTLHSSASFYFYTDFPVLRSDNIGAETFAALRDRVRASGRPLYALLYKYDDEPRRQELIPGDWHEIKRSGDFALWELRHTP